MKVTFVDFNKDSLALARENAVENRVVGKCAFVHEETTRFLSSRFRRIQKYDYVDVDPFGTPAPFLQGAFDAASDGAMVSITATDTPVLCGVYPEVARRRYSAVPLKSEFKHETGLRILLNACRRAAAINDIGIQPVLAHSTKHYLRVYARAVVGARNADSSLKNEGYLMACRKCHQVEPSSRRRDECVRCGSPIEPAGPLWTGPLVDERILDRAIFACEKAGFTDAGRLLKSFTGVNNFPPYSYALDKITSELKVHGVSDVMVSEELAKHGRMSMRTPFEKTGLKSDADYSEVVAAVRAASGRPLHPIHT